MKTTAVALPLIVLGLAACQPGTETKTEAPPAAEAPAPEPAAPAAGPRAVSNDGVGALNGQTPFTDAAIRALYPDSEVRAEFLHEGSATTPIISVIGPNDIALEIQGGADGLVSQVLVQGGDFTGPNGEALLANPSAAGLTAADCAQGEGRWATNPVCRKSDAPNLLYLLALPNYSGGDLPDPTTLNGRARLSGWLWTAP